MKIGKSFDSTNLFNKSTDDTDDITEGTAKLFYPDGDKTKVGYLPTGQNAYLEIEKSETEPSSPEDGQLYYNTTESKFYLYKIDTWVEVLFSMEEIVA